MPSITGRWQGSGEVPAKLAPLAISLAFSSVVLFSESSTLYQAGSIDPYVYAAYVNDYIATFQRFGQTYYSSRIAYIFLDHTFIAIFGQTVGLFLCRLVMLTAAAVASFQIARRYFAVETAILSVAWLCFIPWLLRSISWTHYDGFAVVYTLVGLALLLVPVRRRHLGHATSGFVFALAVNCNLHLLIVIGLFAPSWLFLNRGETYRSLVMLGGSLLAGFLIGYATLQLIFSLVIGAFGIFLEGATFGVARSLIGGAMRNWFKSMAEIVFAGRIYFLIPVVACLSGVVAAIANFHAISKSQFDLSIAAALYGALLLAAVFTLHYFLGDAWLDLFFYNIYFLPACLLSLISIAGIGSVRFPKPTWWICYGASILLCFLWFTRQGIDIPVSNDAWVWFWAWLLFALATLIASFVRWSSTPVSALLVGVLVSTYGIIEWQPGIALTYALWPGNSARWKNEKDTYLGAVFLQKFIEARVPTNAAIGFWYGDEPEDKIFTSVQSMFLWGYTKLQSFNGPAMPEVDDDFRMRIRQKAFIAILARNESKLDAAFSAIKTVPMEYYEVARATYTSPTESYVVALAELYPVPVQLKTRINELKLEELLPQRGTAAIATPEGLAFTTASCLWCYSLTMKSPAAAVVDLAGQIFVRVRLIVRDGKIGIAASNIADDSDLLSRVSVTPRTFVQTIDMKVQSAKSIGQIIFLNESPIGPSRAVIHSVEYYSAD